jgi:ketosteroid isomerase-like protein
MAAVRRSFEGLARGDLEAATADFAPTVEIDDRDIPDADGHDSYYEWIGRWNESWASWRIEDLELRPSGEDKVVALFRIIATGRGSGVELERDDASLVEFRAGKVVRIGYYNDQRRALEAAGLSE